MPLGRVLPEGQARVGPLCYCIPSTSQVLGRWPVRDRQESPVPEALVGGRREKRRLGASPAVASGGEFRVLYIYGLKRTGHVYISVP